MTYCHHSTITISGDLKSKLLFPGAAYVPAESQGYVRSDQAARQSVTHTISQMPRIPFRDYPDSVRVDITKWTQPKDYNRLIISARNVLNEYGYAARISGKIYSKSGFVLEKHQDWLALEVSEERLQFNFVVNSLRSENDILIGLPLVVNNVPMTREFFVANCSDMAHVFQVHPLGYGGTSASAWVNLSNRWQSEKDKGTSDHKIWELLEEAAKRLGVKPSRNLLHSCIGVCNDGTKMLIFTTGSLDQIARYLCSEYHIQHAFVLDNGGSVGPIYIPANTCDVKLLVGAPNRRTEGTAFIELEFDDFLSPLTYF